MKPILPAPAPFVEHFEESEQERMVVGCRTIAPWIQDRAEQIIGKCVEFGPFLNPLLEPDQFPKAEITFVDRDITIINQLREKYGFSRSAGAVCFDLNSDGLLPLKTFNVAVVSQVL